MKNDSLQDYDYFIVALDVANTARVFLSDETDEEESDEESGE